MTTPLPTRALGKDGPQVTAQGWGAMGLSAFYGKVGSDEERLAVLDKVYDLGVRFWDSADIYGDSEDLIGKWFATRPGRRDDVFLATKFSIFRKPDGTREYRNEPEYIRSAVASSLRRLGVDRVDMLYCHRLSGTVPVETVVGAMAEFVKSGQVGHLGLSECSADSLRRACAVHQIAAVQVEYSPWTMDIEYPEVGLLKACRDLGVAVVPYSPLGRGMLTGKFKSPDDFEDGDFRKNNPRFSAENFPKNLAIVEILKKLADKKGVTASQLTLAWLMRQGSDIIPIPGTTNPKNLEENVGALKVNLTAEEDKEIRAAVEKAEVHGDRYPNLASAAIRMETPKP